MLRILIILLILTFNLSLKAQTQDAHRFKSGESLTYSIYYYLWGVWVGAGEVTFSVAKDEFAGKSCFKFQGYGTTYPRYNWFYKVEDTYTAQASLSDLKPYRFHRDVHEGGEYYVEENVFDYNIESVYRKLKYKDDPLKRDTFSLKPESFDVLSLLYHTRDIDFASYAVGDKIPINMVIDGKIYELYIRFLGTEIYEHSEMGKIDCYVFSPLLVEGTIFKGGENMKVWVTKDDNVIPVYVQSEIRAGSIRSELKAYSGIKTGVIKSID